MTLACRCGSPAHFERHEAALLRGICLDCYKTLDPAERSLWIQRKARRASGETA